MSSNLPVPNTHMEVLYRQTYNTLGGIIAVDLTQVNYNPSGDAQIAANSRVTTSTNKGILAGSVVAVAGNGLIGPALSDGTNSDMVVGVAVNDAVGNPFESSSAVASEKIVYLHGTGSVFSTDLYETADIAGGAISYAAGDVLYASQHGLLTNADGLPTAVNSSYTAVGIVLKAQTGTDQYMTVQMKI